MYTVYVISNNKNDMKYVGVTGRSVSVRFQEHIWSAQENVSNAPLHIAMRELGFENFSFQILEEDIEESEARCKELEYISKFHSLEPNGYNTYRAGMAGHTQSEGAKQQISDSLKGHVYSAERNERVRQAMTGRDYKQEWADKLSECRRGKFLGNKNPFYGKTHDEATKAKILATKLKYPDHHVNYLDTAGNIIREFDTFLEAGRWVVAQGLSSTLASSCAERISKTVRANSSKVLYGGVWRFKERSID